MPSALVLHCVSWKVTQGLYVPVARMALYLALHSCIVSALADVPHKHSAVTNETTDYHHGKVSCGWEA